MGLLNVIKLANDYNKAKKLLKNQKVDKAKIKESIAKIQEYIKELKDMKNRLEVLIVKAKERIRALEELLKIRKAGK